MGVESTTIDGGRDRGGSPPRSARGGVASVVRGVDPGHLLTAVATVTAGLSVVSLWWALPTAVAAFLAGRRPGRTLPTALVLVALLAAGLVAITVVPAWLELSSVFVAVVVVAAMLPWFSGRFWRQYQELVRAGWQRAGQLEREQRLVAEQARLRERARIAQDMHDVLGHDLSLIALSAGALQLSPDLDERHRAAARDIRARAAAAVERLGEVVGVLRDASDAAPERARAATLERLVEEAAQAGLAVRLRVAGDAAAARPSPVAERAAYRVVQEALTNAAKHAPDAEVAVRVDYGDQELEVRVENGPPPGRGGRAPAAAVGAGPGTPLAVAGGGRGLIGLDERVRLAGGSFACGPYAAGFAVTARIPHTPPARPERRRPAAVEPGEWPTDGVGQPGGPGSPDAGALPREHQRARRRVRRTLVAALMLPLVTGAVLSAVLVVWNAVTTSRAVLDPADYARLRVGQDRSEVERVLPDQQTVHRPSAAPPKGGPSTCAFYAVTADPFDDRSGDAYRLCFRGDRLVSLDVLTS
ncbi:sensor histidine kinase [Streptomyces buecherae]|uniref:sensor histidine kinase n=1 Tax=Streptomyces buecherae TaxID=2763006 RepID=UPI0039F6742A